MSYKEENIDNIDKYIMIELRVIDRMREKIYMTNDKMQKTGRTNMKGAVDFYNRMIKGAWERIQMAIEDKRKGNYKRYSETYTCTWCGKADPMNKEDIETID